jgi:hypothetical protein
MLSNGWNSIVDMGMVILSLGLGMVVIVIEPKPKPKPKPVSIPVLTSTHCTLHLPQNTFFVLPQSDATVYDM